MAKASSLFSLVFSMNVCLFLMADHRASLAGWSPNGCLRFQSTRARLDARPEALLYFKYRYAFLLPQIGLFFCHLSARADSRVPNYSARLIRGKQSLTELDPQQHRQLRPPPADAAGGFRIY